MRVPSETHRPSLAPRPADWNPLPVVESAEVHGLIVAVRIEIPDLDNSHRTVFRRDIGEIRGFVQISVSLYEPVDERVVHRGTEFPSYLEMICGVLSHYRAPFVSLRVVAPLRSVIGGDGDAESTRDIGEQAYIVVARTAGFNSMNAEFESSYIGNSNHPSCSFCNVSSRPSSSGLTITSGMSSFAGKILNNVSAKWMSDTLQAEHSS